MGYTIGDPLPDPLHLRALDAEVAVPYLRWCSNEACGFQWATVEIPLHPQWIGKRADMCPVHHNRRGYRVKCLYPGAPMGKSEILTRGMVLAVQLGAYYRRRKCKQPDCLERGVRWSTIEVQAGGYVTAGVYWCPKCKSPSICRKEGPRGGYRKTRKPRWLVKGGYRYRMDFNRGWDKPKRRRRKDAND